MAEPSEKKHCVLETHIHTLGETHSHTYTLGDTNTPSHSRPQHSHTRCEREAWSLTSWRNRPIHQQPEYADAHHLHRVTRTLSHYPPLVQPSEVDRLKKQLAEVAAGKRFILQGGDCAERFQDCSAPAIEAKLKILLQMSVVLIWASRVPLVRIGRIAGQYMKPRSSPKEMINGREVHAYRGDSINALDENLREPDPARLLQAYFHSAATLNFIRGLLSSGFADIHNPATWDLSFVKCDKKRSDYESITEKLTYALDFIRACGVTDDTPEMRSVELFTSHEGLVLDFEEAMTRVHDGKHYNLGAHFLWIGDRTRQLDGAHVEYFRGIQNPIGIKIGPSTDPSELIELVRTVNPDNEPGRVTLITRFGAKLVNEHLPRIIRAIKEAGLIVVWECDPMHGNTRTTKDSLKTRHFDDILKELLDSFNVHEEMGTWLGGVHFELTGDDVTECTGGSVELDDDDLPRNYQTSCDPRLNYSQSLEMAFLIASHLDKLRSSKPSPREDCPL